VVRLDEAMTRIRQEQGRPDPGPGEPGEQVLLLRGINVGGIKLPMAELARILQEAGFAAVCTVLATGNAILTSELDPPATGRRAEQAIDAQFGHRIRCLAYPGPGFAALATGFPVQPPHGNYHRYLSFTPSPAAAGALAAALEEQLACRGLRAAEPFAVHGPALGWVAERGTSTSDPLAQALQRLAPTHLHTTRNLNTVQRIARILRAPEHDA